MNSDNPSSSFNFLNDDFFAPPSVKNLHQEDYDKEDDVLFPVPIVHDWHDTPSSEPETPSQAEDPAEKNDSKPVSQALSMIHAMRNQLDALEAILRGNIKLGGVPASAHPRPQPTPDAGQRIVEGVFNGESMIGPDGEKFSVPPNYASKSKLVEGDLLKLTISKSGSFIYKQISPVERKRIVGELVYDEANSQFSAFADGRSYKLLTAAVTFYKGRSGDEVVILVPQDGQSGWAAVENIINKNL